ncbi:MAG: FKBP-type peptidyl-prolyl cis-trans isomerase, partial [Nocardioidaceae bacterium]
GYGPAGNKAAGIGGTDTLVFVIDIEKPPQQPAATGTVDDVTASGSRGTSPKLTFDRPLFVDDTQSKVLRMGAGKPLEKGDAAYVNYRGINACTGETFYDNVGREAAKLVLDESQLLPGLVDGLVGERPGSRVLIAIPRDDAYGAAGNPQAGITGTDTLLFVVDIAPTEESGDHGSSD